LLHRSEMFLVLDIKLTAVDFLAISIGNEVVSFDLEIGEGSDCVCDARDHS